jgi:hypothetical protein
LIARLTTKHLFVLVWLGSLLVLSAALQAWVAVIILAGLIAIVAVRA